MSSPPFKKVLVANRGEIAVRILRTLREMKIASVAVYSDADRGALHVRRADEAYPIGPAPAARSYLDIERLVDVARRSGADALAPGYGFLAENPELAEACERAGVTFVGPPAAAIRHMGSKTSARRLMADASVPVVPGGGAGTLDEARATADRIGYPILLKASAGGGGKGMRRVERASELEAAFSRAVSEAKKAFGDDSVYIEKALHRPRHVEIQVLGDRHGNLVHLFERDCSIQRRHQKVVEETPSPGVSAPLLERMAEIALRGARAVGYHSAGTFEFLVDGEDFYFLEMNTRLQVEHPITELATGIDLVEKMLDVAAGRPLGVTQSELSRHGAAIECRVYAENPDRGFLPSPGRIRDIRAPGGPGVRDDGGADAGCVISPYYDPLIGKLCVWGPDRRRAVWRMQRALSEYVITGIVHNLGFLQRLVAHAEFVAGRYDTSFIERHVDDLTGPEPADAGEARSAAAALAVAARAAQRRRPALERGNTPSAWALAHRARLGRRF